MYFSILHWLRADRFGREAFIEEKSLGDSCKRPKKVGFTAILSECPGRSSANFLFLRRGNLKRRTCGWGLVFETFLEDAISK